MFSWSRLRDADPVLRCEMASTGEVSFRFAFFFLNQADFKHHESLKVILLLPES